MGDGSRFASLAVFVALAPFARIPLGKAAGFIPAHESAQIICDLITAALLFGPFAIGRSRGLLVLGSGYLFTRLNATVHGLSFPGAFSATGLLHAGQQTTAWLYMAWHGGVPVRCWAMLIRNAMDAALEGPVSLRIGTMPETQGMVEVFVADNGPGLPPEVRAHQFQPFVTTKRDGMGVGLSICQSIVQAHGGRIWAEDSPGGGTVFRFTVPAAAVAMPGRSPLESIPWGNDRRRSVAGRVVANRSAARFSGARTKPAPSAAATAR